VLRQHEDGVEARWQVVVLRCALEKELRDVPDHRPCRTRCRRCSRCARPYDHFRRAYTVPCSAIDGITGAIRDAGHMVDGGDVVVNLVATSDDLGQAGRQALNENEKRRPGVGTEAAREDLAKSLDTKIPVFGAADGDDMNEVVTGPDDPRWRWSMILAASPAQSPEHPADILPLGDEIVAMTEFGAMHAKCIDCPAHFDTTTEAKAHVKRTRHRVECERRLAFTVAPAELFDGVR
jgi:hypothetical protein